MPRRNGELRGEEPGGTCERLGLGYPLVIEHSHGKWPIEIDGLPMNSMVIFHGKLLNNQMVDDISP